MKHVQQVLELNVMCWLGLVSVWHICKTNRTKLGWLEHQQNHTCNEHRDKVAAPQPRPTTCRLQHPLSLHHRRQNTHYESPHRPTLLLVRKSFEPMLKVLMLTGHCRTISEVRKQQHLNNKRMVDISRILWGFFLYCLVVPANQCSYSEPKEAEINTL